jgi:hypothetical protein
MPDYFHNRQIFFCQLGGIAAGIAGLPADVRVKQVNRCGARRGSTRARDLPRLPRLPRARLGLPIGVGFRPLEFVSMTDPNYSRVRTVAQRLADETGRDYGLERLDSGFRCFALPARHNRAGFELACEVVMPAVLARTHKGHGPCST